MVRRCLVALSVCLWGCEGPSRTVTDAAVEPDASIIDGAVDAPGQGLVTVAVNSPVEQRPLPDAPVLFIEAGGATTRVMTDALGRAEGMVTEGVETSVTVVFEETRGIATITKVEPGDALVFGAGPVVRGGPVDVTFSAYGPGAASYRVFSTCSPQDAMPGTTTMALEFCFRSITNTTVRVMAYDDQARAIASAVATGVDLSSGAVTVPNTWTPTTELAVDYVGVPQFHSIEARYSTVPELYTTSSIEHDPPHDVTFTVPGDATDAYVHTAVLRTSGRGSQQVYDVVPAGASTYQLNVGAALQPWIGDLSYTEATRTVTVQPTGVSAFDVVQYTVFFGFSVSPIAWNVYAPDLGGVVLPVLPADLDLPSIYDALGVHVVTYEAASLTGWDMVRPNIYGLLDQRFAPLLPFGRVHLQARYHDLQ